MRPSTSLLLVALSAIIGPRIAAQAVPPVRSLGSILATSPVTFASVTQIVSLSDGRVLVADLAKRRMLLLDRSLANPTVVLDSTPGKENSFLRALTTTLDDKGQYVLPSSPGQLAAQLAATRSFLISFRADSSIWYDVSSGAFAVIGPSGKVDRVFATPVDGSSVWVPTQTPSWSAASGLVFTAGKGIARRAAQAPPPGVTVWIEDSSLVERMNLSSRALDTVAGIAAGAGTWLTGAAAPAAGGRAGPGGRGGGAASTTAPFPLFPFYDDVVTTTDGTIAIFHAREYRIEWLGAGSTRLPGARLTYPWHQFTDAERKRIIDSVNAKRMKPYDSVVAKRAADSARLGSAPTVARVVTTDGVRSTQQVPAPPPRPPKLATQNEVTEYAPATTRSSMLADADNHGWLRPVPLTPEAGFVIWDVISRTDGVVDRVRIPESRTIAGFGPGGFIYLVAHDGGVATLEKVKLR